MPSESDPRSMDAARGSNGTRPGAGAGLIASLRPRQWTKNGLLFLALIFSLRLTDPESVLRAILAFVSFSALSSGTYLLNDLLDVEQDRRHPTKRTRPIAAGIVAPGLALTTAATLSVMALALAAGLGLPFLVMALLYLALTLGYSLSLKHVVILDVLALSGGFVVRAAAGAAVIGVPISPWLYVCTILGSLLIALGKRRHELLLLRGSAVDARRTLQEYTVPLIDQMMSVAASATIIAYSLYTFAAETRPENPSLMLTVPFVLYGVFRYLYLTHAKGDGGSPEDMLLGDRPLLLAVLGWGATSIVIIYFFS